MPRIVGIDLARALAILGMFAAHLGFRDQGWWWLADGRSSALFALLAGAGLGFMTRKEYPNPAAIRSQRSRILWRAAYLALLGVGLFFLNTPVVVILTSYALMFVLAVPFLALRPSQLCTVAAAIIVVAPPLVQGSRVIVNGAARPGVWLPGLFELATGYYPALVWLAYCLVGLAVVRLDLSSWSIQGGLIASGLGLMIVGYGLGVAAENAFGPFLDPPTYVQSLVAVKPHTDSGLEVIGNVGFCLVLIGACLVITRSKVIVGVLYPVWALGSMSLTIYVGHLLFIWVLGEGTVLYPTSLLPLFALTLTSLVFSGLWKWLFGRGPLEKALAHLSSSAVSTGDRVNTY